MTVLEIKKALECCYAYVINDSDTENCHECPYIKYVSEPCFDKLIKDALKTIDELEKRNEPVTPVREIGSYSQIFRCRNCDTLMVFQKQKYCHECGQAVKW